MDREEYLEEYLNSLYGSYVTEEMYSPDVYQTQQDFRAGHAAAKIEWNKIEDKLPDTDRKVLVFCENKENRLWSGYKLGAYLNDQWYFQGGRDSDETVTQWYDFPDAEI